MSDLTTNGLIVDLQRGRDERRARSAPSRPQGMQQTVTVPARNTSPTAVPPEGAQEPVPAGVPAAVTLLERRSPGKPPAPVVDAHVSAVSEIEGVPEQRGVE